MLGQLEKRLKVEQDARAAAERQLAEEKKRKKLEEATAARAVALAAASRYASRHDSIIPQLFALFYEMSEQAVALGCVLPV